MAKKKQEHITDPENIVRALNIKRQQDLSKEKLYPALTAATVSVDEAKMLLQSISSLLMEDSLTILREKKVKDIFEHLVKKLCPDGARETEIRALLETIQDETLFVAKGLTEGMGTAIDYMIRTEMMDRTLNSFNPDWDKMMTR